MPRKRFVINLSSNVFDYYTTRKVEIGNERLLKLANHIEQHAPRLGFDQNDIYQECGAPGCLMGWNGHRLHRNAYGINENEMFYLTAEEHWQLFDATGCANAGTDWKRAVAFVRQFVADRRKLIARHLKNPF